MVIIFNLSGISSLRKLFWSIKTGQKGFNVLHYTKFIKYKNKRRERGNSNEQKMKITNRNSCNDKDKSLYRRIWKGHVGECCMLRPLASLVPTRVEPGTPAMALQTPSASQQTDKVQQWQEWVFTEVLEPMITSLSCWMM